MVPAICTTTAGIVSTVRQGFLVNPRQTGPCRPMSKKLLAQG
jgi:hypothetical protein